MNIATTNVLDLSISERIQLVEDIWDSVIEVPNAIPLTNDEKAELDQRLYAYHQNPDEGSPWGVVCERIKNKI